MAMSIGSRSVRLVVGTAFVTAISAFALASGRQPETTGRQPSQDVIRGKDREYFAWIPPGTYSAIVVNSSGEERRWAVSLVSRKGSTPIIVPPGQNVVVPFEGGWTVDARDEARLVSRLVPFDDSSCFNLYLKPPDFVIAAYGIGPDGPVPFIYR